MSATPQKLEETVPIPPPKHAAGHDDTIRLTPEQVRAFQDASYSDWVSTTDHTEVAAPPTAASPVMEAPVISAEPAHVVEEPSTEVTATPMFGPAAEPDGPGSSVHEIFSVQPAELPVHAVVHDISPEAAPASERPFFAFEAAQAPTVELAPLPELINAATQVMPAPIDHEPVIHELETSAAIPIPPAIIEPLTELEPTIAPSVEVTSQAAPELEINSPIHLQEKVEAIPDPGLITNDGDMSEFVTKFGMEKPEEINVGLVSELSPEQLTAVTSPAPDTGTVEEPLAEQSFGAPIFADQVEGTPAIEVPHSVFEEVQIEPSMVEPVTAPEPVVAFVPGMEDSQSFGPYTAPPITESEPIYAAEITAEPVSLLETTCRSRVACLKRRVGNRSG